MGGGAELRLFVDVYSYSWSLASRVVGAGFTSVREEVGIGCCSDSKRRWRSAS